MAVKKNSKTTTRKKTTSKKSTSQNNATSVKKRTTKKRSTKKLDFTKLTPQRIIITLVAVLAFTVYGAFTGNMPLPEDIEELVYIINGDFVIEEPGQEAYSLEYDSQQAERTKGNVVEIQGGELKIEKVEDAYPEGSFSASTLVKYKGFHLSYNEKHEQANWVAYILTKKEVKKDVIERTDDFREDKGIPRGTSTPDDYAGSGYDRGHLAPAADMHWSEITMHESFFMSNMSPQEPQFNRGIWKKLEEHTRDWAVDNQAIYVVTGPVLNKKVKRRIGDNKVSVPAAYYKVILDISPPKYKGIAFYMENEESDKELGAYAISIDELEKITNIDFFKNITNPMMSEIESSLSLEAWDLD